MCIRDRNNHGASSIPKNASRRLVPPYIYRPPPRDGRGRVHKPARGGLRKRVRGLREVHSIAPHRGSLRVRKRRGSTPVSYTHLRAHETRHDLVCRLLLEKK